MLKVGGEALDHAHAAGAGLCQPRVEDRYGTGLGPRAAAVAADDPTEPASEIDDFGRLNILQNAPDSCRSLGVEIVRFA